MPCVVSFVRSGVDPVLECLSDVLDVEVASALHIGDGAGHTASARFEGAGQRVIAWRRIKAPRAAAGCRWAAAPAPPVHCSACSGNRPPRACTSDGEASRSRPNYSSAIVPSAIPAFPAGGLTDIDAKIDALANRPRIT